MMLRKPAERACCRLLLAGCVLLGGCFSTYNAAGPRAGPMPLLPADAWPRPETAALDALLAATPREIRSVAPAPGSAAVELPAPDYVVEYKSIDAGGLLRVWSAPTAARDAGDDPWLALLGGFEPDAAFLTAGVVGDPSIQEDVASAHEMAARTDHFLLAKGFVRTTAEADVLLRKGIAIQMPARADHERKGLVVYLTSLIPNKYEAAVVDALRDRGWAVVGVETETRLRIPPDPAELARIPALRARAKEYRDQINAMFMEPGAGTTIPWNDPEFRKRHMDLITRQTQIELEIHRIRKGRLECCDEATGREAGRALALAADKLMAEQACAVEAALNYLRLQRGDVPTRPTVLLAFSAGALGAPAVAARLGAAGQPPDAVVLVGGGADLSTIIRETELKGSVVPIVCNDKPAPDRAWKALNESYLAHTRLDPVKTAPLLTGTPVLQIHSSPDTIVPARTGRKLYELLGKPDRIDYSLGHVQLFGKLPEISERIADWVESHVPTGAVQTVPKHGTPP